MRLVLLRKIPEDAELRQEWNQLINQVERPQVFYTYEWSLAVQRAYHAALHPLLFLAYDEQESLCGVASLATGRDGGLASFLCATTGDYCDFLCLPEHKRAFVARVLLELRNLGIEDANLTNLPADSDTVTALKEACVQNGYRLFSRTAFICTQVSLGKFENRLGSALKLPGRKMLRRSLSAMGQHGAVRLDHARSWVEVEAILPQFIQAHVARFLATDRISNVAFPERRIFLAELAKLLSESGWLVFTRMMSGDKALAWNYGFRFRDTWFWYQPTFDSDLEKYSPGFCLLTKLIEEAAESPELSVVDLGLGAEQYKERFANQTRETLYVTLRTSSVLYVREILRYRVAEGIKAHPKLEAETRAVLSRWHKLRESVNRDGIMPLLRWLTARARAFLWSKREIFFLEWSGAGGEDASAIRIEPLNLNRLACAAMQYLDDDATLAYLLRSASRLRESKTEGFVLTNENACILNFGWVAPLDGFLVPELKIRLDRPAADCVILFDCWAPSSKGAKATGGQMISVVAERMREKGLRLWIYSPANNTMSIHGLGKSSFHLRYSLVCRRALGWQIIRKVVAKPDETLAAEECPPV